jgi:hypothetical protein
MTSSEKKEYEELIANVEKKPVITVGEAIRAYYVMQHNIRMSRDCDGNTAKCSIF